MDQPEQYTFHQPTRQSVVAIILIIFKYIKVMLKQVWPFVLVFFIGGGSRSGGFIIALSIITGFSMIWAIIAYFKFYFYIENDELIIQKGVLNKTNLNIPFDRIQTINVKQNIVHQILNVVELEVDTAGTKKVEFSFDALSKDKAEALKSLLISKSKPASAELLEPDGATGQTIAGTTAETTTGIPDEAIEIIESPETIEPEKIPILNLSISDLLKVGLSQNHFRSIGFVVFGLFWIQDSVEDAGIETDSYLNAAQDFILSSSFTAISFLAVVAFIIAVLISLVRTVLTYFNAHLWREGLRLKLSHGLFNKKEVSAHYDKIQMLNWGSNLFQKKMGIFDIRLKQASSAGGNSAKSLHIQGCSIDHVDYLKESWLGTTALENLHLQGISIHYFERRIMYRMFFVAALLGWHFYFAIYNAWVVFFALLIPYFIYTSWLSYTKSGFAVNDQTLYISKGVFDDDFAIIPLIKIQDIKLKQTPYQFRNNLCDIRIATASGAMTIPYVPLQLAENLANYLLYKVEISNEKWM